MTKPDAKRLSIGELRTETPNICRTFSLLEKFFLLRKTLEFKK